MHGTISLPLTSINSSAEGKKHKEIDTEQVLEQSVFLGMRGKMPMLANEAKAELLAQLDL